MKCEPVQKGRGQRRYRVNRRWLTPVQNSSASFESASLDFLESTGKASELLLEPTSRPLVCSKSLLRSFGATNAQRSRSSSLGLRPNSSRVGPSFRFAAATVGGVAVSTSHANWRRLSGAMFQHQRRSNRERGR